MYLSSANVPCPMLEALYMLFRFTLTTAFDIRLVGPLYTEKTEYERGRVVTCPCLSSGQKETDHLNLSGLVGSVPIPCSAPRCL